MHSYFIDTNYFLRLLLKDEDKQFEIVYILFQKAMREEIAIFTSVVVFFEIYWVLSTFYQKNKQKSTELLVNILKMDFVDIEQREILKKALFLFTKSSLDLEDCYNISLAKHKQIDHFATFDKKLNKEFLIIS